MREGQNNLHPVDHKINIKLVLEFLLTYFKNPLIGMRQLPHWDWLTIFLIQIAISSLSGLISGLLARSVSGVFLGFFFFPLSSLISHLIVCSFFYYTILFFYKTQIEFRKLYILILLAHLPFLLMIILSSFFRPLTLLGLAITAYLLIIGLSEQFLLPKKLITRFILILYAIYVVLWINHGFNLTKKETVFRKMATPESLDILEKELQGK